jgi:hypothetical protein
MNAPSSLLFGSSRRLQACFDVSQGDVELQVIRDELGNVLGDGVSLAVGFGALHPLSNSLPVSILGFVVLSGNLSGLKSVRRRE